MNTAMPSTIKPKPVCARNKKLKLGIDVSPSVKAVGIMTMRIDAVFNRAAKNIRTPCILNFSRFTMAKPRMMIPSARN